MIDIRACLKENGPLLFDGAMGTCFAARPGRADQRCELANLTAPDEIDAIHRAYLDAGCRAVKTNTFTAGVDPAQGREELAARIIEAACRIAKGCAAPYDAYVFADLGPAPEGAGLGGEAEEQAVAISSQIAREIAPYTDGLYLMTPFRRVAQMTRILERLSK